MESANAFSTISSIKEVDSVEDAKSRQMDQIVWTSLVNEWKMFLIYNFV